MKKLIVIAALGLAQVAHAVEYTDTARVSSVTPRYEQIVVPQQSCQFVQETVQERSNTGAILGGVAGAIIGSQVGGGNGRIVTGALGAGIGAIAGDRIDNRDNVPQTREVQRCTQVNTYQSVIHGYNVTYSYNGRYYQTVLSYPAQVGDMIRIQVNVNPY